MSSYYNAVQYPWADQFEQVYTALENAKPNVPAQYQTAYLAALRTAGTIDDQMQAGTTINADTVNEFLFAAHNLVARFPSGNLPALTNQTYQDSTPGGAIADTFGFGTETLSEIETVAIVGAVAIGAILLLPILTGRK